MGRKRKLNMAVRVVPPGTLSPNPLNPYRNESPAERRRRMLDALARGLLAAERTSSPARTDRTTR